MNARSSTGSAAALVLVFFLGCKPAQDRAPVHDSVMVNVLIDLHLAAARAEIAADVPAGLRDSVLEAHSIDSTTYLQAIEFYAEHPGKYLEVYSRVLDRLNSERIPLAPSEVN